MPDVKIVQHDIEAADNWQDAYLIGEFVNEQASGEADKLIMDAYEKAFGLGLNIRVNRDRFLKATKQIARIYFQFCRYDDAINKLMVLDANESDLPDWVNLDFAAAQIHTENILYWAEEPELLFRRIDGIDETNPESVRRRKYLFLEYLNRISELSKANSLSKVNSGAILSKAEELGLLDTEECLNFKAALGIIPANPDAMARSEAKELLQPERKSISVYEQMIAELNRRLSDQQTVIDKQALTISHSNDKCEELQRQITTLQEDKKTLNNNSSRQEELLKSARKNELITEARCKALESQLLGSEEARRELEENASVIGELQADIEDLKRALSVIRKKNESLHVHIEQDQKEIEELKKELACSQEESQALHSIIENQKRQIEVAEDAVRNTELALKAAEERNVISQKASQSEQSQNQTSVTTGQPKLLDILLVENYLPRKQKILVIGGSETKENHLRGKLKSMGFNFSKDQLEFELEYDNVKDYAARIRPWSGKYAGIIVGPCPHKAKDIDGYSSFIEQIKTEEGYPHVEEARDKAGALKISNTSIGEAMMKMAVYLQSIA